MKYLKSRILILILICIFTISFAQPLQNSKISIQDGLSNAYVHHIFQDSYGLLWISTQDGLNLYDGYKFKIYKNVPGNPQSIINNAVWQAVEDQDKNMWVATDAGVSKYDRSTNIFTNYDFEELFPRKNFQRVITVFVDSSNTVWAGTGGLDALKYNRQDDIWQIQKIVQDDTTKGVLPESAILGITQDNKGRIWAGSFIAGLLLYDQEKQEFYPVKFSNPDEVPEFTQTDNAITTLFADPMGIIWITTRNGIYKYNPVVKQLKTIKEYTTNKSSFFNYFNWIMQDKMGNVWITNNQRGVLQFDGISDEYKELKFAGQNFNREHLSNIIFTRMLLDRTGIMWFGTTTEGLLKYDPQTAPFRLYQHDPQNPTSISSSQVFSLFESKVHSGDIYVGTRSGGLNLYNPKNDTFSHISPRVINKDSEGSIRSVLEEDDGTLWLGSWGNGLLKMDKNYKVLKHFISDSTNVNSLPDNLIRVIEPDNKNNLWIGTNSGLAVLNKNDDTITRISQRSLAAYPQALIELIRQKFKSGKDNLLIDKVGDFKNLTKEFKILKPRHYVAISSGECTFPDSLMYDYGWITTNQGEPVWTSVHNEETYYLGGASKNRIKIDVIELRPGQYKLHYKTDDSHSYNNWNADPPLFINFWGIHLFEIDDKHELDKISGYIKAAKDQILIHGNNIRSIHVSRDNIIWIGSDQQGLNRYDPDKRQIKIYRHDKENPNSLSDNSVQYIYEDKTGMLWLATNAGLNRFDPVSESFKVYTQDDGLPTNYIASILPGENEDLWVSTRNGISRMMHNQSNGKVTFVNYDASDGLGGTDFIAQVALKSSHGRYYFGGDHGLNIFTPGETNTIPPSLIFSDLKISNTSVLSTKNDVDIKSSIYDLKNLDLPYDKNDLSFEFSALHYSNPKKNQYAHMLKGYDKEWIYDNSRTATYTNLDPGSYTFMFKGTNRDGIWNERVRSLAITIHPPWWRTLWAYISYGLFFIAGIFAVDRMQRRRLMNKARERMRLQEAEMRAETAELQAKAAEAERRALEAENARKTRELDEARELQLSMLPKQLPKLPNLDIAVYMKTATEVGGDYYDFHVSMDGTLTVVIGDATGHGMKAGTMVTTAKSLFNSYAPNPDILYSFREITRCIKQMNMGKMSMCMTMLKIQGSRMQMSSAGMPPSFIFRRDTRIVEEHLMQGMPLGTMNKFPYKVMDTKLQSGDTILLLSDGLPELQNENAELYGYKRVRNIFEDVAEKGPDEIINSLKEDGSAWVSDKDPEDDVTFVVIKVK